MSVNQKFSFLSPGVKLNEVDLSLRGEPVVGDGALIIGQTKMGPAMTPVVVKSLSDFEAVFGPAQSGQSVAPGEGWRTGNHALPTYGAYAAQAWLRNNSPITFVRLVGKQNADAIEDGEAGWMTTNESPVPHASQTGGAYGLWVFNSSSSV